MVEISRCAFGLDYMKKYRCRHEGDFDSENPAMVTGLMGYDQSGIIPIDSSLVVADSP